MSLELPSIVFETNTYSAVIDAIKRQLVSIGQYLGKGAPGKKTTDEQRVFLESKKQRLTTIKVY